MTGRFKSRLAGWPIDPVLRRLRALGGVPESEEQLIRGLGERRERYAPGDELISEGDSPRRPRFLLAGWAACQRVLPDGRRQIFRIILPGDALGFAPRTAPETLWSIVALTAIEALEAEVVLDAVLADRMPGLRRALAMAAEQETQLLLDHMVRLGQQTAYERVAHFLIEIQKRLQVAGLGDSQRFPLPLTQEILADALGLSIVHVNRTLQQLRREGLIELRSGVAILLRPEALQAIANYETPTPPRPRSAPPPSRQLASSPA